MELTGACKQEFEKKMLTRKNYKLILGVFCVNIGSFWGSFYKLPESMQYGVQVDYFDSVGVFCEDRKFTDTNFAWVVKRPNLNGSQDRYDGLIKTRPEARTQAISKANETRNEQLKQ